VTDPDGLTVILLAPASSLHTRRWATALAGRGHRVVVASWTPGDPIPGAEVRVAPGAGASPAWRLAVAAHWLRHLAAGSGADVVHVHSLGIHGLLSLALPPGPPRVVTPWGSELRAARHGILRAAVARRALRSADLALPTSAAVAAELTGRYAMPSRRVRVLSWGVAEDLIAARPRIRRGAARAGFGLPADATVILSCRSTSATYRTSEIVSAFSTAAASRPGLFLVLLRGHRPGRAAAARAQDAYLHDIRRQAHPYAERILVVPGTLGPQQAFRLMCASDIAVSVPAADQRSSSVLEAALAGCRLLLSDIPPYRELVAEGLAADLVAEPLTATLAGLLVQATPDLAAQRRNREFILGHERGAEKAAALDGIYRQLTGRPATSR